MTAGGGAAGSVGPRRRRGVLAAVALVVAAPAVVAVPGAWAHGGTLLGSAIAGPYRTQVTAAPLVVPGRPQAIDVTVYLSSVASNTPISDARVRTTVRADGRTVRPTVHQIAGGYEAIVPVKDAFSVGKQTIDVDITGPRGTGHVTVRPFAQAGGPPTGLLVGSGVALVLLGGFVLRVRRRRADATADPDGVESGA